MMEKEIKTILLDRGYSERNASLVARELLQLSEQLRPLLSRWISNEEETLDYEAHGYTIRGLMTNRGMTYPAALLTIDWLIKEPEQAKRSLTRGIK